MSAPGPAFFIASAARQKITKYVDVAALALLVVDYLGTLEMEVANMWPAKWSVAKVLFFLSRYSALLDVPLAIYYHTALGLPVRTCRILFSVESSSLLVGVALSEAILFLRVYALSGRNRKFLWVLLFQFFAVHIAEFIIFGNFLTKLEFGPSRIPTVIGCSPLPPKDPSLNVQLSALFGLILANELAVLLMTFVIGLMKYRNLNSPLIRIFYRDGFFYFLVLSAISAGNITADLVGPPEYRFLIVVLQRVLHSILASRMILHMRDFSNAPTTMPGTSGKGPGGHSESNLGAFSEPRFHRPNGVQVGTTATIEGADPYFPGAYSESIELSTRRTSGGKRDPENAL